ncbi:hypothetical protein LT493_16470 [Streptomyces tricolor]|nr:hypothetical protein [Streptomyces tricolor]
MLIGTEETARHTLSALAGTATAPAVLTSPAPGGEPATPRPRRTRPHRYAPDTWPTSCTPPAPPGNPRRS